MLSGIRDSFSTVVNNGFGDFRGVAWRGVVSVVFWHMIRKYEKHKKSIYRLLRKSISSM
jgi:hypothetical protein